MDDHLIDDKLAKFIDLIHLVIEAWAYLAYNTRFSHYFHIHIPRVT